MSDRRCQCCENTLVEECPECDACYQNTKPLYERIEQLEVRLKQLTNRLDLHRRAYDKKKDEVAWYQEDREHWMRLYQSSQRLLRQKMEELDGGPS